MSNEEKINELEKLQSRLYTEDNELFEVTDEEELKEASEVLEAYNEDPTIQEVKNSI